MFEPRRFASLILDKAPINDEIVLTHVQRKKVWSYLRRRARKSMGKRPRVKMARSFALDPGMYRVFEENDRQFIAITSLKKNQRTIIPLSGQAAIAGNLRVVLLPAERKVEVHVVQMTEKPAPMTGAPTAMDVGVTEVGVDDEGHVYGPRLGEIIEKHAARTNATNKKRNKLRALAGKYEKQGKKRKARNIRRRNLGGKKQIELKRRAKIGQTNEINRALAEYLKQRQPSVCAVEKLDLRRKAKSKKMSRKTTLWLRSTLAERIEFKASAAGSRRKHVNPAYTSQECPWCGFVDAKNRNGDTFKCTACGAEGQSDQVAAINQKARLDDPRITVLTPKAKVKSILLERYKARLESQGSDPATTVPGQTSDRPRPRKRRQSKNETLTGKSTKPVKKKPRQKC